MACCGRGNSPRKQPARTVRATPAPAKTQIRDRWIAPRGSINPPDRFCQKCGWANKKTKFIDPVSGATVEHIACTNRRCQNYK